jgi:ABC-type branched-subunit amino acid transport system substrate-binding protein
VLAEPEHIANDNTIWLGAMFPLSGAPGEAFGRMNANAFDLARRDFTQMSAGVPRNDARGPGRPIGIILCDDTLDPRAEARHLADEVGVSAVVGFHRSEEAIDLATSFFLPRRILVLSTLNQSPLVTKVPQAPGEPRLVWRTTPESTSWATSVAEVVSRLAEPSVRTDPKRRDRPIRVTFLRGDTTLSHNAAFLSFATALFERLRFNGVSALANGPNYREVFVEKRPGGGEAIDDTRIVQQLLEAPPDVILAFNDVMGEVAAPLEARWPRGRERPFYVGMNGKTNGEVLSFFGKDAARRRRFVAVELASGSTPTALLSKRYGEFFPPPTAPIFALAPTYDAFYVLAYAALAAGEGQIDGLRLAQEMRRIVPRGPAVDVGPTGIFDAARALASGGSVNLNGAGSLLDFDPATGETSADWDVLCIGPEKALVPSGLVYRAASKALEGRMACRGSVAAR